MNDKVCLKNESRTEENSTQFISTRLSNNYLSYTFRAFHYKDIKNKKDVNNYIYDLDNTLNINLDIIKQFTLPLKFRNDKITSKIERIIELVKKRKNLKKKKNDIKSQILVNHQIVEEYKRRYEENLEIYSKHYKEIYNALEKKVFIIKKYYKKYDEIEEFVQRECKYYPKWKKIFDDYEISPFLIENENLKLMKKDLEIDINNLNIIIISTTKENNKLKKKNNILNIKKNSSNNNKYEELIEIFQLKCDFEKNKIQKLNRFFNKIKARKILFPINKKNFYLSNNITEYLNSEKTMISIISNNNKGDNCIISNMSFLTQKSNIKGWDISCIEKNEDF